MIQIQRLNYPHTDPVLVCSASIVLNRGGIFVKVSVIVFVLVYFGLVTSFYDLFG